MYKKVLMLYLLSATFLSIACHGTASTTLIISCKGNLCNAGTKDIGTVVIYNTSMSIKCLLEPKTGISTWHIPDDCLSKKESINVVIAQPKPWIMNLNPNYRDNTFPITKGHMKLAGLTITAYQHLYFIHKFKVSASYK